MERLTRRNKVNEGMPIKHLNLMHMDTTSEDTLTEILERLSEYEDTQLEPYQIELIKADNRFLQEQNKRYREEIFHLRKVIEKDIYSTERDFEL